MVAAIHYSVRAALVTALQADPGLNGAALAREHGVSAGTVTGLRRDLGLLSRADSRTDKSRPDDEAIRAMWAEGLSASEIGRRLQRNKNSIIGRVQRLKLAKRGSPIGPSSVPPDERARRNAERKVAYRAARRVAVVVAPVVAVVAAPRPVVPVPLPAPVAPLPALVIAPVAAGRVRPCCWPVETVGKRHVMCDAASLPRLPYCAEHDALAHGRRAA